MPGEGVEHLNGEILPSLRQYNFVSPQTVLLKKECVREVGEFDERLPALEDWEMWLRVAQEFEFEHIDDALATAYISEDSMSVDYRSLAEARNLIVRKHRTVFDEESASRHLFWSGQGFMKTGRVDQGRRNLMEALTTDFQPLYLACFAASLFGSPLYTRVYELVKRVNS